MFKVIDMCGNIHDAYGTFVDNDGDVQFIFCDCLGRFYKTNAVNNYYTLYEDSE